MRESLIDGRIPKLKRLLADHEAIDVHLPDLPLGVGFCTAHEAARLLDMPVPNVNRWLKGYTFRKQGEQHRMPPLRQPQLAVISDHLEIGFRDLVELRFVKAA